MGLVQRRAGVWREGRLHYALNVERCVTARGAAARGFLGIGRALGVDRALHPLAAGRPRAPRRIPPRAAPTRGVAVGLVLFTGLTQGVFVSFGLLGWTLAASAALLHPRDTWDLVESTGTRAGPAP